MTLQDGIRVSLSTLKQVMKDAISCSNIDVATHHPRTDTSSFPDAEVEEALKLLN